MDNTPTIYTTPESLGSLMIRVMGTDEAPIFVAPDIAKAMRRGSTDHMLRALREDEKGQIAVQTPGGPQLVRSVTEAGLYRVLMRSNSANAGPFQDWVVRDVLPTIRKTGSYVMGEDKLNDPDLSASDLDKLNDQLLALMKQKSDLLEARVAALTAENAVTAPKAVLVDTHIAPREFDSITKFVRTFAGVNSQAVKQDLTGMNYWETIVPMGRPHLIHLGVPPALPGRQ